MSASSPETPRRDSSADPERRSRRHPVERLIVWGGIGVLLAVLLVEARAVRGYTTSLAAVQEAMQDNEKAELTMPQARALMALSPKETITREKHRTVHEFAWLSLFKSGQYVLTIDASLEEPPSVLTFRTPAPPESDEPAPVVPVSSAPSAMPMAPGGGGFGGGMGMGGDMGMGGGTGRGQRRSPPRDPVVEILDTDRNGELTLDELEQSVAALKKLDRNGDGELTPDELLPPETDGETGAERPARPAADDQ